MKPLIPLFVAAVVTSARGSHAACSAASQLSTCIDVDVLWPRAGAGRFTFVGGATTTSAGQFGIGVVTTYLARPLVLQVPVSTVNATEAAAVDRLWNTTILWSGGLTRGIELSLAVPFTTYRSGTGISALSSQHTSELSRTAVRDVRVGAVFALFGKTSSPTGLGRALASRLELALPVGESSSFAGDRFIVAMPSVGGELSYRRLVLSAELGARMRATSELAGSRVGTQIVASVGMALKVLEGEQLSVQLEAITLPTLAAQHQRAFVNGASERANAGTRAPLVPTEWLFSLRAAPLLGGDVSATIGAGGALPIAGEYGITSPAYRLVAALRYAPSERP